MTGSDLQAMLVQKGDQQKVEEKESVLVRIMSLWNIQNLACIGQGVAGVPRTISSWKNVPFPDKPFEH